MQGEMFKQYYKKIAIQGALKSLLVGLIFGFSAVIITSIIIWITGAKLTWLLAIVFFAVLIGVGVLSYFIKFKPDTKMIAKKLDETGLEERMITMLELKDDDSFIARMQREDAKKSLANVNKALLKFTVGAGVIASLVATGVCAASGVTVDCLTEAGVIKSLAQLVEENQTKAPDVFYTVKYDVQGEGYLSGDFNQIVLKGSDSTYVTAEAEDGWVFVGWLVNNEEDENIYSPYRKEIGVKQDLKIIAVFEEIDLSDPNEPKDFEENKSNQNDENEPGDKPNKNNSNNQQQNQQQTPPKDANPGPSEGGKGSDPQNQIIDGKTYCSGEVYNNAKNDAIDNMKNNDSLTDEQRKLIEDYFDSIKN